MTGQVRDTRLYSIDSIWLLFPDLIHTHDPPTASYERLTNHLQRQRAARRRRPPAFQLQLVLVPLPKHILILSNSRHAFAHTHQIRRPHRALRLLHHPLWIRERIFEDLDMPDPDILERSTVFIEERLVDLVERLEALNDVSKDRVMALVQIVEGGCEGDEELRTGARGMRGGDGHGDCSAGGVL